MKLKATKKYLLIEEDQRTIKTLQNALSEFKNWNCIGVTYSLEMANSIQILYLYKQKLYLRTWSKLFQFSDTIVNRKLNLLGFQLQKKLLMS